MTIRYWVARVLNHVNHIVRHEAILFYLQKIGKDGEMM